MCGRYVTPTDAAMEREYGLTARQMPAWLAMGLGQNHNACPTQSVPILRVIRDQAGERVIEPMRWGLIPPWAKGQPQKYSTINAMAETIESKPLYRGPWKRGQRCVFPIQGFYEWQVQPDGSKHPYFIRSAGDGLLSIGGLWESSVTEEGVEVLTCTVITLPANELLAEIHNAKQRMPLILEPTDIDTWLSGTTEQATELLQPYPPELLRAHRVSTKVNSPKNNEPALIEPLTLLH